jgi:hypothetical protein
MNTTKKFDQLTFAPVSGAVRLPFTGTTFQTVRDALIKTFGPFPIRLSWQIHLPVLWAMIHASGDGSEPYQVLYGALDKFLEIEINEASE